MNFPPFIQKPLLASLALLAGTVTGWAQAPVSFQKDIAPILQRRCAACHGEDSAKGGYRLDSFEHLQKPGESDLPALTPGKPADSELHRLLVESDANDRMPQKADALPAREIALIERWILQGALNDAGSPGRPLIKLVRDSLLRPAPEKYARPAPVTALAFSPDGRQLAAAGYYEITLWDVETGTLIRRIGGLPERITSIAWHPKTNRIAVGGGSPSQWGGVFLIDPGADFKVRLLADLPDTALSVVFSPDGKWLAAAGGDRSIRLFDAQKGTQTRLIKQHADWVQSVAFSRDSTRLVSASRDRTARIFPVDEESGASSEVLAAYDDHGAPVLGAVFATNGKSVFSIARNQPVHIWSTETARRLDDFKEAGRDTQVLLVSDFGLLTGSTDHLVRLSDYGNKLTRLTFYGHRDCVEALAVAPGGQFFASGAHDGEICLWTTGCESPARRFLSTP